MVNVIMMACVIAGIVVGADGIQILSKSKLEKCEKTSDSGNLNCSTKIVLNLAVPSGSVRNFFFPKSKFICLFSICVYIYIRSEFHQF